MSHNFPLNYTEQKLFKIYQRVLNLKYKVTGLKFTYTKLCTEKSVSNIHVDPVFTDLKFHDLLKLQSQNCLYTLLIQ